MEEYALLLLRQRERTRSLTIRPANPPRARQNPASWIGTPQRARDRRNLPTLTLVPASSWTNRHSPRAPSILRRPTASAYEELAYLERAIAFQPLSLACSPEILGDSNPTWGSRSHRSSIRCRWRLMLVQHFYWCRWRSDCRWKRRNESLGIMTKRLTRVG